MATERAPGHQAGRRVETIELFFDLVFVFTVTQLAGLVEHAHGPLDLLRALLVLTLIWWMYDGYAWLTNAAGTPRPLRLVLLAAMAGFLVIALAIPGVAGATGLAFGLAYLAVVLVHLAAFGASRGRAVLAIAPFNLAAAALAIAAGLVDADWDWLLLLAAAAPFLVATLLRRERAFAVDTDHFVERHGLIVIIALGESVVAIGTGAGGRDLDARTAGAVVLALGFVAALWWAYFDRDDDRAARAMAAAAPPARARIAILGYFYAHLAMLAGIVALAAGIHRVVAGDAGAAAGWLLAGGLAGYLLGDVGFRAVVGLRPLRVRALGAALALAFGALGTRWGGPAELAALTALALALLALEARLGRGAGVAKGRDSASR
jgi:low temperature requirement protein LtrA